jgi:adenylate cyclase
LEDALRIEPDYAAAHALLAWCYEWCYSRAGFHEADKQAALSHAHAALTGSTDDATALSIAGFVITMLSQDHEAGLNASERALALNPSCATALYLGAITNAFSGRPATATAQASRALRLSPFDLLVYLAHLAQGVAAVQEGATRKRETSWRGWCRPTQA